jgi:hypothetical protein
MSDIVMASRRAVEKRALANSRRSAARVVAELLCLAAAPAFAVMALLTAVGSEPDFLCAAMLHASPLGGMTFMYSLMSIFHLPPWLKLMCGREASFGT